MEMCNFNHCQFQIRTRKGRLIPFWILYSHLRPNGNRGWEINMFDCPLFYQYLIVVPVCFDSVWEGCIFCFPPPVGQTYPSKIFHTVTLPRLLPPPTTMLTWGQPVINSTICSTGVEMKADQVLFGNVNHPVDVAMIWKGGSNDGLLKELTNNFWAGHPVQRAGHPVQRAGHPRVHYIFEFRNFAIVLMIDKEKYQGNIQHCQSSRRITGKSINFFCLTTESQYKQDNLFLF